MKLMFGRLIAVFAAVSLVSQLPARANPWPPGSMAWEHNSGPDPATEAGRRLIDIGADLADSAAMSTELTDGQKFRFPFGMMLTRAYFDPNTVKIFFVGQDATHIAEAAKQPGTSGFGARVQSIGNYFGVDQGVATTNAYVSTIKGQYGSFDHPYVYLDPEKGPQLRQSSLVGSDLWALSNDPESDIVRVREQYWEWMIKNNPESLRLIVLFGGAARDAFAQFLVNRGAKVGTRIDAQDFGRVRVPLSKLVYAGGNNEFPVPVNKDGADIYEILVGRKLRYEKEEDQKAALDAFKKAGQRAIDMMVFPDGGVEGSGVLHPAQLGGYDLNKVEINGQWTNSLKGLVLSDGTVVKDHIGFTMSPHPTALSRMTDEQASATLKKAFTRLENLRKLGWTITPDLDEDGKPRQGLWQEGKDYRYGRADIRPGYFEFGAPDDRRVSRADASRLDWQTIVAGTRDRVKFAANLLNATKSAMPAKLPPEDELWTVRPRGKGLRYVFDRGPGPRIAKLLMSKLDREKIFALKPGFDKVVDRSGRDQTFEKHGIDAYYTKTHSGTGFFGMHRGNFENSRALILADPQGLDDWITSRALTGARGQFLHGLMSDLAFDDQYLVIKTVPVGMDGANPEEWEYVRSQTEGYRETAIAAALKLSPIEIILTDGEIAKAEMKRVLKKIGAPEIPVVNIQRTEADPSSGIVQAGAEIKAKMPTLARARITGRIADIPRSHLTWWSRWWEGTSGDRVIDAEGKYRGGVRALVVPDWVVKQAAKPLASTLQSIKKLKEKLEASGLLFGAEKVRDYVARRNLQPGLRETPHGDRHGVVVPFTSSRAAERKLRPQCLRLFQRAQ